MAQARDLPAWKELLMRLLPSAIPRWYRFLRWYRLKPFVGYLRRSVREGGRGRRTHILFYPELPNYGSACLKIALRNGYRVTNDPNDPFDVAFHYEHGDQMTFDAFRDDLPHLAEAVNRSFDDIRKEEVGRVFEEVFGYDLRVNPRTHEGPCVEKSNKNGMHDGRIVECPVDSVDEESVYQKVIDNRAEDGLVQDIRVPIFRLRIPFVYLKYRSVEDRFSNANAFAELCETDAVLSDDEVERLLHFCSAMSMDYGELDVLRDHDDGRIYVVDANFTPAGRPNGLSQKEADQALKRMAQTFEEEFVPVSA